MNFRVEKLKVEVILMCSCICREPHLIADRLAQERSKCAPSLRQVGDT